LAPSMREARMCICMIRRQWRRQRRSSKRARR